MFVRPFAHHHLSELRDCDDMMSLLSLEYGLLTRKFAVKLCKEIVIFIFLKEEPRTKIADIGSDLEDFFNIFDIEGHRRFGIVAFQDFFHSLGVEFV